jgi:hypothetical protein
MDTDYFRRPREAREDGRANEAGDLFTTAAYAAVGDSPPWTAFQSFAWAERAFLEATLCYRLADRQDRSRNRKRQGTLVGEDLRTRTVAADESLDRLHEGAIAEFLGDLHVIATDDRDAPHYGQAIDRYRTADDTPLSEFKTMNGPAVGFFNQLAHLTDSGVEVVKLLSTNRTLPEWLEYKRTHLPTLRDQILDVGIGAYAFSQLND